MGTEQSLTELSLQGETAHQSKGGNLPKSELSASEEKLAYTGRELAMTCPLQVKVYDSHYCKQNINTCIHLMLLLCTFYSICVMPVLSYGTIIF